LLVCQFDLREKKHDLKGLLKRRKKQEMISSSFLSIRYSFKKKLLISHFDLFSLRFFFLSFLEVDNGRRGADSTAATEALGPVLLPVTRLAIQLQVVGGHVLQLQHFIARIAFEASSVVFVVADHDLLSSIHGGVAFRAFCRLNRLERHFQS